VVQQVQQEKKADPKKLAKRREHLQEEYAKARSAYHRYREELGNVPQMLKEAALADGRQLEEEAVAAIEEGRDPGGEGESTPHLEAAKAKAVKLEYYSWASERRMLRLGEELRAARLAELEPRLEEAYAQLQALEEEERALAQRKLEAQNSYHALASEASDMRATEKHDKGRLAQIENDPPVAGLGMFG
jgi:hypothetical protein